METDSEHMCIHVHHHMYGQWVNMRACAPFAECQACMYATHTNGSPHACIRLPVAHVAPSPLAKLKSVKLEMLGNSGVEEDQAELEAELNISSA